MKRLLTACLATCFLASIGFGDDGELLRDAARRGDLAKVKELIERKADLNAATEYGVTPLAFACDHGHDAVAQALLDAGANPNTKDKFYRFSPLAWAVMKQNANITKMLLDHGAEDADSVLGNAVGMQQPEMLRVLIASEKTSETARLESLKSARNLAKAMPDNEKLSGIIKQLEDSLSDATKSKLEDMERAKEEANKWKPMEGTYQAESGSKLAIKLNESQLLLTDPENERSIGLERAEDGSFTARGLSIQFQRDGETVTSFVFKTGEREVIYKRVVDDNKGSAPSTAPSPEAPAPSFGPDYPLASDHWPSFRGTLSRGINDSASVAKEWDGESGKNIAWKCPIDGLATSSPIVWGKNVFITTAVQQSDSKGFRTGPYGDVESVESDGECSYQLWCVELETGAVKWKRETAHEVPKVKRHAKSSHANPTPTTDGKHVVASFGGAGVYCYDFEGNLIWKRNLGMLDSGWFYDKSYQWGFGSSPFLFEDLVLLQCDVQEGAFLIALDVASGETRWRTERTEIPTWSSPVAYYAPDGTPVVIATGTKCTAGYHARTGEKLWSMGGFSEIVVPTPQVTPSALLLTSGYAPVQPIVALQHSARGEIKIPDDGKPNETFYWSQMRGGPYMPTPVVFENRVYILDNSGILTCLDLASGKRIFRQRLRGSNANAYTSSPVAAGGHLYCTSEEGHTFVVTLDRQGNTVAENDLGEAVLSSPAVAGGKLLLRGERHLFAIDSQPETKANP